LAGKASFATPCVTPVPNQETLKQPIPNFPASSYNACIDHDHSYKLLFSHPEMVADLLRGFVLEDWVKDLDFATLERVSGGYVADDLRERGDDIVWRVRFGREWLYVYLLIEFQSAWRIAAPRRMWNRCCQRWSNG